MENADGLIRGSIPKEKGFPKGTGEEVRHTHQLTEGMPRKVQGNRTDNSVYREILHSD